jgi:NADPH-dependent 2,4-dienoyl-CoA reductase/sulfur reductase-like enzyme
MSELNVDYVIIGGGIAGVSCAETLCQLTSGGSSVLMISGSALVRVAANVAQLTQTLVQFDVQENTAAELQEKTPGLKVLAGVTVESLDPGTKQINLSDGRIVRYLRPTRQYIL